MYPLAFRNLPSGRNTMSVLKDQAGSAARRILKRAAQDRKTVFKIILFVIVVSGAVFMRLDQQKSADIRIDSNGSRSSSAEEAKSEYYVDISGAVASPGVYRVTSKTRLFELIEKAGGLTQAADLDSLNQAAFVKDGEKIVVACKGEEEGPVQGQSAGQSSPRGSGRININSAGKNELMEITGVGEVIAERIIEYRKNSRFTSVEDIKNVRGIGEATFEKMKPMVSV